MREAHALLLGPVRTADLSFLRGARRGPPRDAGREAGSRLSEGSEGSLGEQASAPRVPRASRLSLFSAGQARPGAAGARDGEGAVPGVGRVHGPSAVQSEEELSRRGLAQGIGWAAVGLLAPGCVTAPYDYTNYRLHPPRSIVVLPPLNQSTAVEATYGYLTTVTRPLAERGYYVFPIAVVDQFLKENGLPSAGEMHQ